MSEFYKITMNEDCLPYLTLEPLDGNRGAKIVSIHDSRVNVEPYSVIVLPAIIESINGEKVTKYVFHNIKKLFNKFSSPVLRIKGTMKPEGIATPITPHPTEENHNHNNSHGSNGNRHTRNNSMGGRHTRTNSISGSRHTRTGSIRNGRDNFKIRVNSRKYLHYKKEDSQDSYNNDGNSKSSNHERIKCGICKKALKPRKQHYCKRCADIVCAKCSVKKRYENGFDKLVRVCDMCVEKYEYEVEIKSLPLGLSISPLFGKSDDKGGILVLKVKMNGSARGAGVQKQSVIWKISDINIQNMPYTQALNILLTQKAPFKIKLKVWNSETKKNVRDILKERLKQKIQENIERENERKANEELERKKELQRQNDNEIINDNNTLSKPTHVQTISQDSNNSDDRTRNNQFANTPKQPTFVAHPHDAFGTTQRGRFNVQYGTIYEHPAYQVILEGNEYRDRNELDLATQAYDEGIKIFKDYLIKIDNLKQKREWGKIISEFEISRMKVYRKNKLRKRSKRESKKRRRPTFANNNNRNNTNHNNTSNNTNNHNSHNNNNGNNNNTNNNDSNNNGNNNNNDNIDDDDRKDLPNKSNSKDKKKGDKKDIDNQFRARLEQDIITENPNISFKDVLGLSGVKLAIYETVILPQKKPHLFRGLRKPSMGLLLFGPPGNGKTMIAKCVATEIESTFFSISASSITSKWVGEAERIMRTLFGLARERAPSIIFIDEIDSLLTARGGKSEAESSRRIKTEFLIQFDGVHNSSEMEKSILLIGATNLPDQLDEAVLRRFSKRILVPNPDTQTRYGLLRNLMENENHVLTELDFQKIAKYTENYSCSDIKNLCKDAAMGPMREIGSNLVNMQFDKSDLPPVNVKHFESSLKNVRSSLNHESLQFYHKWDKKFGSKFHLKGSELPEFLKTHEIQPLQ